MKDEIISKVKQALQDSQFDAVLVLGFDNVQYLSGAYLHYPACFPDRYIGIFWARDEDPICIIPNEWESSFLNLSWINRTRTYTEKPGNPGSVAEAVANLAKNTVRKTGKIGLDFERVSLQTFQSLESTLQDFELIPCDDWIHDIRIIKTPKEIELLKKVASKTDHAIAGHAHHVLVKQATTEMSNTENVRIHALERRLEEVGHHAVAQVVTGPNTEKFWPRAPFYGIGYDRVPQHHDLMRIELVATMNGYWCNGARMLTMGEPTDEQIKSYGDLVAIRDSAIEAMKPGVKAKEVYEAMKHTAEANGVRLAPLLTLGAGVGVTNYEPPYLSGGDDTEIKAGMVIVLNPVIEGAGGEL
jgi:Xaa-Pro dipeptidase